MMNEGTEQSPPLNLPPLGEKARVPQSALPPGQALRTSFVQNTRSRWLHPPYLYIGIGATLVGFVVTILLFSRRNHDVDIHLKPLQHAAAASNPQKPVVNPAPPVAVQPAPVSTSPENLPQQQTAVSQPITFKLKQSRIYERIGPIRLRLVKANPKRSSCDLYIVADGPAYQKQARVNKPIHINLPDNEGFADLTVTSIGPGAISGSVLQTK